MQMMGEHCSMTERRADDATRDVMDWLKCEFMMDKIGEEFDGIISSVTSFGLFVQLNEIYVDGLVHITALKNDYYHFDAIGHRLTGERNGQVFRLGDSIKIKVAAVNLDDRKIDFVLSDKWVADAPEKSSRRYAAAGKRGKKEYSPMDSDGNEKKSARGKKHKKEKAGKGKTQSSKNRSTKHKSSQSRSTKNQSGKRGNRR
jgi:ribonuclease R